MPEPTTILKLGEAVMSFLEMQKKHWLAALLLEFSPTVIAIWLIFTPFPPDWSKLGMCTAIIIGTLSFKSFWDAGVAARKLAADQNLEIENRRKQEAEQSENKLKQEVEEKARVALAEEKSRAAALERDQYSRLFRALQQCSQRLGSLFLPPCTTATAQGELNVFKAWWEAPRRRLSGISTKEAVALDIDGVRAISSQCVWFYRVYKDKNVVTSEFARLHDDLISEVDAAYAVATGGRLGFQFIGDGK